VSLRERHALYVGVEQDELANVPSEAVLDPCTECLVQSVLDQIGVQGMIALSGIRHLDLAGQDGLAGVTPVESEIMPPRGAAHVVFDKRVAERQIWPTVEDLGNPAGHFRGEGAFVNWHISRYPLLNGYY
jgi:hypothetical protein